MTQIELIIALFAAVTAFGVLATWMKIPYPILLVLGGLLLSLQPWAPRYELPPNTVFLLFLPPLLYSAAFNTEWALFRQQLRAISLLAIGLVLFTTVLVAAVCHYSLGLPWGVGFVLGAIVSPPDAVAATAITQRVKLPRIVNTILEGESLVNDASALVAYRVAIAAVVTGFFDLGDATKDFFVMGLGGIGIGIVGAMIMVKLHRFLNHRKLVDAKLTIMMTLLTPYAVYLPAEHLHVSGVLATVAAGLWIGTRCSSIFDQEWYLEARTVWEMMEFVLNGLIFILIGFQLPLILDAVESKQEITDLAFDTAMICGVVILSRLVWIFPAAYLSRWFDRVAFHKMDPYPPVKHVFIVGWTGMRGVVSLAAAMAIPMKTQSGELFPHRELIQFLTFWVIFATLVLQGLSLPFLIRWLRITDDDKEPEPDVPNQRC